MIAKFNRFLLEVNGVIECDLATRDRDSRNKSAIPNAMK